MNGDISFGEPWSSPHPQPFPQPVPIIAPFWAGFNLTCGDGDVLYRQTTSNSIRGKVVSDIQSHLSLPYAFDPSVVVIATWNHTSYYGANCNSSNDIEVNIVKDFTAMINFNSVFGMWIHDIVWYILMFTTSCPTFKICVVQFGIKNWVFCWAIFVWYTFSNTLWAHDFCTDSTLLLCFTRLIQHLNHWCILHVLHVTDVIQSTSSFQS